MSGQCSRLSSLLHTVIFIQVILSICGNKSRKEVEDITNIRAKFLISVGMLGDPWNNCSATVSTPFLKPNGNHSTSPVIHVGNCDRGPMTYSVTQRADTDNDLEINVTFYTSALGIKPPSCNFNWTGGYLNPTPKPMVISSPLPGCYLKNSQPGYHPTDYMFHLLTWEWFK